MSLFTHLAFTRYLYDEIAKKIAKGEVITDKEKA